ncbi:hypothetical protein MASR1M59_25650 [Melaminivora sp.]
MEQSRAQVYDWLLHEGIKFMPAVNLVERGMHGDGNSVARYHIVWGTSRFMTLRLIEQMRAAGQGGRLTVLHGHRVTKLEQAGGRLSGAVAVDEATGREVLLSAPTVVLAMGGINGGHEEARRNWPAGPADCRRPCSTARIPLPTGVCTAGPPSMWARRSPTRARCGTTPPAFRTRIRTFRAMACRSFRASRPCG